MPASTQTQLRARTPELQTALAAWFARHARDLPWRRDRRLYTVVVSEFMLQQTRVDTVLPYFERWQTRFPDFGTLAAANEEDVLKHWEGLGYYSRARNLHKLAREVAAMKSPPQTAEGWQELPGVGPYTAAAIASLACGDPAAVVDGNVVRILTRLSGDETLYHSPGDAVKACRPLAEGLLDHQNPGLHNEALMELGATVCHKQKPLCTACPLLEFCTAGRRGDAETLPRWQRTKTRRETLPRLWIERADADGARRLLLHRAPTKGRRLQGLCELPRPQDLPFALPHDRLTPLATRKRGIGNTLYTEDIFLLRLSPSQAATLHAALEEPESPLLFVALDRLDEVTLTGPHKRWTRELQERAAGS